MKTFKYQGTNPLTRLHPDEPWFFIRGQDRLSTAAVIEYSHLLRYASTNAALGNDQDLSYSLKKQADEVLSYAQRFKCWQLENPDKVKYPD